MSEKQLQNIIKTQFQKSGLEIETRDLFQSLFQSRFEVKIGRFGVENARKRLKSGVNRLKER